MRVGLHQPNFFPWCGFFAKLAASDVFVIYDDAQVPNGRSYASRVKLRNGDNEKWLSLPIEKASGQTYTACRISAAHNPRQHLTRLQHAYGKAPFFDDIFPDVSALYENAGDSLVGLNIGFLEYVVGRLGLETRLERSSAYPSPTTQTERIVQLTQAVGGDAYLSGPGGQSYMRPELLAAAGVRLEIGRFQSTPYTVPNFPFIPNLSILDALFIVGPDRTRDLLSYEFMQE